MMLTSYGDPFLIEGKEETIDYQALRSDLVGHIYWQKICDRSYTNDCIYCDVTNVDETHVSTCNYIKNILNDVLLLCLIDDLICQYYAWIADEEHSQKILEKIYKYAPLHCLMWAIEDSKHIFPKVHPDYRLKYLQDKNSFYHDWVEVYFKKFDIDLWYKTFRHYSRTRPSSDGYIEFLNTLENRMIAIAIPDVDVIVEK